MNKKHLAISLLAVALMGLAGCSSTGNTDANKERSATLDYRRQGIKITYDSSGKIDAIEVIGYAAVWGNSQNAIREAYRVAELEAKKTLNDFINKETITSSTSVRMISQNLEQAKDRNSSSASSQSTGGSNQNELVALDEDPKNNSQVSDTTTNKNAMLRSDATRIASRVSTTITTNNRGILGGLYMVEGKIVNDGKTAQVVLRWDQKSNQQRQTLRNLMSQ
jgi:hypothetical protein